MLVNGTTVKKNMNCVLNSGDEVVFGFLGNHAYVSFCAPKTDMVNCRFSVLFINLSCFIIGMWYSCNFLSLHLDFSATYD